VTITLSCPHCRSKALVRDGHAPNGKQKDRCHACGRRSRENPTPMPIQKLAVRRFCTPPKNASLLRGLTRTFGVSRATVSSWIKKS